jgi:hypothetical protein
MKLKQERLIDIESTRTRKQPVITRAGAFKESKEGALHEGRCVRRPDSDSLCTIRSGGAQELEVFVELRKTGA